MEKTILWLFLISGIILLFFSLRKRPIREMIVAYLLTSYFTIFLGGIVVEEEMLHYPVNFLDEHFDTSLLFEYIWFPLANVYFYQTTYRSSYFGIFLQGALYSSAITTIEIILENYTHVIEYHTWTWIHTYISVFILMIFIRFLMTLYNKLES